MVLDLMHCFGMFRRVNKLFRFRYSVRGLLIAVTLPCFTMGWFAIRIRQAERQAAAAKTLTAGFVVVGYDYMLDKQDDYSGSDVPPVSFLRRSLGNDFFSNVVRLEYSAGEPPECRLTPLANVWGLRHLSLRGTKVADADFDTTALRGLQTLDVAFTDITDAAVSRIATLSQLQALDLTGTEITDASLEHLRTCPMLRYLTLQDTLVSEPAIQRLKLENPSINVVWSHSPSQTHLIATRTMAQLGAAVHFVEKTDATADVDFYFAPGYRVAVIGSDSIWNHWKGEEKDLLAIKHIEGVSNLYLTDLSLTDGLWQLLSELPSLKSLTLSDMKATGLRKLTEIGNGQLTHLSLANTPLADRDAAFIAELPLLESLSLRDTGITNKALIALEPLQNLRQIDLSWTKVTDAGITSIRKLGKLEKILFDKTQLSDAGLAELQHHSSLRRIGLSMTQITDTGLGHLASQQKIEELDLSFTNISDAGLEKLRGLPQLRVLHLSGTNITDKGLGYLADLPLLNELWLVVDGKKVTEPGIRRLQQALPQLQITRFGDAP